ncbi:IS21 family transposase [Streptomyces sp. NPDC001553]|uniref:IS21 family transposase n=1 Tax=Streptomyces sp. NPDC001553 TaxID=3154385 RepID=UPI00332BFF6C
MKSAWYRDIAGGGPAALAGGGVTWRTVRRALDAQWPEPRKRHRPRTTRLDPYKRIIDGFLQADLDAPPKQKHTSKRSFDRLVDEHGAYEISYQMVRSYVAGRRKQILLIAGRGPESVFIPQSHIPGAEAEVDFGDVHIVLAGVPTRCYLFSFRLSYSGKAVHRVFASCGQEAFIEGHVHALKTLGGVPRGRVRYDNLKAAVSRVIGLGRMRVEAERWTQFRSHWGVDAFYCRPGIEGAHEKGGVEGQVGYFRRNHFVPVPVVDSLAQLNAMVDQWDIDDEARRISSRPHMIGEYFRSEQPSETAAGGAFRDGTLVHPASGSLQPDHRPIQPLLGPRQADRPDGPGPPERQRPCRLRRPDRSRPARAPQHQGRLPAAPGPLPRSPHPEARRLPRLDRAGAGPLGWQVHPSP